MLRRDNCWSALPDAWRVAAGQFDLEQPENVLKLLATMARNKVRQVARREQAKRRDNRRVEAGCQQALEAVVASDR